MPDRFPVRGRCAWRSRPPRPHLALLLLAALLILPCTGVQDPAGSADRPPGNVNEVTLAGLEPGRATLADALAHFGPNWFHPGPEETNVYDWCDASTGLQIGVDLGAQKSVRVVTVSALKAAPPLPARHCATTLPLALARTGRGVRLGDPPARLLAVYGKPFFDGPSSDDGRNVRLIVFNYAWAGPDFPQILESSFDAAGRLVKMVLSADYY